MANIKWVLHSSCKSLVYPVIWKKNAPVDVKYPETGWQFKTYFTLWQDSWYYYLFYWLNKETDLKIHNSEEIIFCHKPRVTQERGKIIFFNYTVTVRLCLGIPSLENNSGHRSPLAASFAKKKKLTCYSKHNHHKLYISGKVMKCTIL